MIRKPLNFCLFLMLLAACSSPASPASPSSSPVPTPGVTTGLTDPAQGLSALHSYRASLRLSFDGTQLGGPSKWSQNFTMMVSDAPKTRLMKTESTGLGQQASYYPALTGEMNDVNYTRSLPADNCQGDFLPQGGISAADLSSSLPELARRLPVPQTMTANGNPQEINGVSAQPYIFDAAAIRAAGASVDGKAWLAVEGGYLVKYELQLKGGNDFFDQDTSGTFTWEYDLQAINQPDATALPPDCPIPLPDLPLPDGAQDIVNYPGYTSFTTSASVSDTADFYKQHVPATGFQAAGQPQVSQNVAYLAFIQGSQTITVLISAETTTTVEISLLANETVPLGPVATNTPGAAATEVNLPNETPTLVPTVDIASLNLPPGLTIYPGAIDLETSAVDPSGTGVKYVTFHTSDTPEQVFNYYNQKLTQAGWLTTDQQTPTPDANGHRNFGWMSNGWIVTVSPDVDPQGGCKVMVTWIKL